MAHGLWCISYQGAGQETTQTAMLTAWGQLRLKAQHPLQKVQCNVTWHQWPQTAAAGLLPFRTVPACAPGAGDASTMFCGEPRWLQSQCNPSLFRQHQNHRKDVFNAPSPGPPPSSPAPSFIASLCLRRKQSREIQVWETWTQNGPVWVCACACLQMPPTCGFVHVCVWV